VYVALFTVYFCGSKSLVTAWVFIREELVFTYFKSYLYIQEIKVQMIESSKRKEGSEGLEVKEE